MKFTTTAACTALALLGVSSAWAGPQCTEESQALWMGEDAMKQQIHDTGMTIKKFKVTSGNCYEIYGHNANGQRVEIYYHPISGEIIKQEIDD